MKIKVRREKDGKELNLEFRSQEIFIRDCKRYRFVPVSFPVWPEVGESILDGAPVGNGESPRMREQLKWEAKHITGSWLKVEAGDAIRD